MQRNGKENGGYAPRGGRSGESSALQPPTLKRRQWNARFSGAKHRRHVLTVFYLFLFFAVLGTAAVLSLTVLFRIDGVSVTGTSRYSEQQIVEASGIQNGDNLILIKTSEDSQAIRRKLPYLGSVEIHRRFPSQVQIEVQAATVFGAAAYGTGYVMIGGDGIADGNGIVLEAVSVPPKDCAIFHGLEN